MKDKPLEITSILDEKVELKSAVVAKRRNKKDTYDILTVQVSVGDLISFNIDVHLKEGITIINEPYQINHDSFQLNIVELIDFYRNPTI